MNVSIAERLPTQWVGSVWKEKDKKKKKAKIWGADRDTSKDKDKQLLSSTQDGREICYAYDSDGGCTRKRCAFAHVCRIPGCLSAEHGAHNHK